MGLRKIIDQKTIEVIPLLEELLNHINDINQLWKLHKKEGYSTINFCDSVHLIESVGDELELYSKIALSGLHYLCLPKCEGTLILTDSGKLVIGNFEDFELQKGMPIDLYINNPPKKYYGWSPGSVYFDNDKIAYFKSCYCTQKELIKLEPGMVEYAEPDCAF
ncbi:MAG: hypothetical protein AB1633_09000 [Elusimicrobiota bacterium]